MKDLREIAFNIDSDDETVENDAADDVTRRPYSDARLPKPLTLAQYAQMSQNRRVYERYIWQTPPLIVGIIGVIFGLALGFHSLLAQLPKIIVSGSVTILSIFVAIIGYWEFRCRILLRIIEANLREFEEKYGHPEFVMYVKEINPSLPWYKRQSSTLMILLFLWGLSAVLFVGSILYYFLM